LGGDVLGSGFVFHEPVDTVQLNLKVKLTVEDEVREFDGKGFFDVYYSKHFLVHLVVVVVFEECFCAVLEGAVVIFVEGLLG
jgi:hypothetical protein